jgi:formylglycine-generating enzyme required for sulfatase activity
MRGRLTKECLARVDAFIAEAQPQKAIELCDAAAALNPNANRWILESLSLERLRGLSEEALIALPPTLLAEAVAAVPETAELALPPLVNSVGMPLRLLHAGTVAMGGQGADAAQSPYQATISKRFFIGVHEVTNLQWKRVMGVTPSKWKDDDRPVEQVTWEEAVEFCRRLSMLPDERAAGRVYRLPTEVEWEYACRAGTTSKRSFGDDRSQLQDHAWFRENASDETHPVGEKTPSPWGLHDMLGNVWEWCGDWHGEFPDHAATDPQGPPTGTLRVHRGGSWASGADRCDSASRGGYDPNHRQNHLGFRVVMTASQR